MSNHPWRLDHRADVRGAARGVLASDHADVADVVHQVARRAIEHWGVATVEDVAARAAQRLGIPVPEDFARAPRGLSFRWAHGQTQILRTAGQMWPPPRLHNNFGGLPATQIDLATNARAILVVTDRAKWLSGWATLT